MLTRRTLATGIAAAGATGWMSGCAPHASKPLQLMIGASAGGASDRMARLFARHITSRYKQAVEVSNEPRANGKMAAQRLAAAKPGDNLMAFLSTGLLYGALLKEEGAPKTFEQFNWMGSFCTDRRVLIVTKASGVQRFEDLIGRPRPLILICGATASSSYYECRILEHLTQANVRIIPGFRGGDRNLALISGEGEAIVGTLDGLEPALDQAGSRIVLRMNDLPLIGLDGEKGGDAPTIARFAKGPDAKALIDIMNAHALLGRIVGLPPSTPPGEVAEWRTRFQTIIADPTFAEEAKAAGFRLEPTSGQAVNASMSHLLSTRSDEIRAALGRALSCNGAATCA
jgi:tripartite-type tricarboxylate transporter receptor subunit TctC